MIKGVFFFFVVFFLFRDLGREHFFFFYSGIWGESITLGGFREQGAEEKHFRELGRKAIFLSGSREQRDGPQRSKIGFNIF